MLIEIFLKIVNMSLGAVPLMAAVLILRAIFKKAVPRKVFYFAWILVFLRLMVPFSFESDFSFFGFLPESYITEAPTGSSLEFITDRGETFDFPVLSHPSEDNPNVDAVIPEQGFELEETVPLTPPQQATSPTVTRSPIEKNLVFATAWAFGTAALLVFGVIGYVAVLRKIKKESMPYANNIILCDFFTTPMVCGFVKPKIILPLTFDFDDEARVKSVLNHENTHIKRLDNLRRLLASFTLYVHWFNPLVWICYWAFIRDMEVSCDEEVLQKSKGDIRTSYAESLVALAGAGTNPLYGGVLSFGETAIKERVKCIMNFKKAKLFIIIICAAVALALGVIFLTNPAAPSANSSFEVTPNGTGEVTYYWEKGAELSFKIKNTGTKTVYVSESVIYKWEEKHNMWIQAMNFYVETPDYTGTTAILPGETITINEKIPMEIVDAFDLIYGKYRVSHEIYSDVEKTSPIGSAEYEFIMDAAFRGFVATDYYHIPVGVDYGNHQTGSTEKDLAHLDGLISSLEAAKVNEFIAVSPFNVGDLKISIGPSTAQEFISLLKNCEPYVAEPTEPERNLGIQLYFQTEETKFSLYYDGELTLYEEGKSAGVAFGVGNKKVFEEMDKIIEEIILNPPTLNEEDRLYPFRGKIVYAEEFEGNVIKLPSKIRYSMGGEGVTVTEYISKITAENVSEIYLYRTPYSGRISIDMDYETATKILHYLSAMRATYPGKTDLDFSNDGTHICVKSGEGLVYYVRLGSDGYFTFYTPGSDEMVVYNGEDCKMAFDAINKLADGIFANAEESEQPYALPAFVASQYKYLPKNAPEHEVDVFTGRENLGDEKKAEYFEKLISGANTSVLSEFSVISLPYESDIYAQISKEEADEFLSYLKRVKVLPGKEENPSTGGALYIYIKYDDEAFTVRYDGRISFAEKGYSHSTVFCLDAEGERLFRKIRELADEILEKNIKKENASLGFTGFVTTKDTFVSPVPIPAEKALGTESNRGDARAAIDSVTENNITGMYVMPFAENSRYEVPLTKKQALRIADLLKGAGLEVLKVMPNPTMAGGVAVHIETKDTAFAVNYSGGTVSFTGKGQNKTYVFGDSLADQVFGAILEIVGEATENAFQTAVPAEGTFLPSDMEIDTVTIFNNTEKLCVPAASNTEDPAYMLYDIIKYSNFTNYGMSTEVSETELTPLTGVDTVEFARTDGKKYTLKLYETGFVLSGSAVDPSEKRVWLVEEKAWKEFKRIARECYSEWPEKHPSWLGLLHFNNVVGAEADFRCENVQNYTEEDSCLNELLSVVKYVQVKGPGKKVDPTTFHGYNIDHLSISIEFRTGVFYTVHFDESMTKFKIGSTDMSYALEYEVTSASQNYYTRLKSFALSDANAEANPATAKPVIYLYPEKEQDISVDLDFNGRLTYTYPALNSGWKVTAKPDGSLINKADGSLHRYLFWEGIADYPWAIEKGFLVAGKDSEKFLIDTLTKMGLNQYEIADFVTYWVPRMIENKYNLISFSGSEYAEVAKLTVSPKPDSVIRIHIVWKGLEAPVAIEPQTLPTYERRGFTLVEWGGTEIK